MSRMAREQSNFCRLANDLAWIGEVADSAGPGALGTACGAACPEGGESGGVFLSAKAGIATDATVKIESTRLLQISLRPKRCVRSTGLNKISPRLPVQVADCLLHPHWF
jgi:hypothetical protein